MFNLQVLFFTFLSSINFFNYNAITHPFFPQTKIEKINSHTIQFESIAAYYDPADKYRFVIHDVKNMPTWLFVMNYKNKNRDELWHRGYHNGQKCNTSIDDRILFHLKSVGFLDSNFFILTSYKIQDKQDGIVVADFSLDHSFNNDVKNLYLTIWVYPHPTIQHFIIVVAKGYIETPYPISFFINEIKWHIETALENFGRRLVSII